jgi:antitoxin Phd
MKKNWQIQEAKQRLSEVIRLALTDGPQRLTCRGEPSAWIISNQDYNKLKGERENIVDFFQRSPHREVEIPVERKKRSSPEN